MKICVISGIFHPEIGGPATHLYDLSLELAARGHQIAVLTYGDPREKHNYPFLIKRIPRNSSTPLRLLKFTLQIIKIAGKYDIFYVDHYGLPVAFANIFLRKPVVIRVASDFAWEFATRHKFTSDTILDFQRKRGSLKIKAIKALRRFYMKKADIVIAATKYVKNMVTGWGIPEQRVKIIYNAIKEEFNISASKVEAREYLNLKGKIVISIGRLISLKGIDKLIQTIAELDENTKLVIVGDGPERKDLSNLAKSFGIEERVIFRGTVPRNKIALYLKAADVFVLNSETEGGLPYVILEAMITGVPVVATNVGDNSVLIENEKDGLLVESGNLIQLKAAICRLLDDEKVRKVIIENAKEKVRTFSFDKTVDEISNLLQYACLKKKIRFIFQRQFSWLTRGIVAFLFYSGALWLIRYATNLLFQKKRIVILAYHRVNNKRDFITKGMGGRDVSPKNFARHIQYLKKNYKIISLNALTKHIKEGNSLPKRAAIITFDDGYQDNYTEVFPILKRYRVPATIFIMPELVDSRRLMWLHKLYFPKKTLNPDEEGRLASRIYLSWKQVREMNQAGISIGSHTNSHRILSQLKEEEVTTEILGSKSRIEEILKKPVLHFAYPFGENGTFTEKTKEMLRRSGFLSACTRREGANIQGTDPYAFKRIGIGDCKLPAFASKLTLSEFLTIFKKV